MIHIRWRIFLANFSHHLLVLAAGLVFVWAIFLSLVRLALPLITDHPIVVETALSSLIDAPTTFEQLNIHWHKLQPEVELIGVNIWDKNHHALMRIPEMNLRISLFTSLLDRKMSFGLIQIKDWKIRIEQNEQKQWRVIGIKRLSSTEKDETTQLSLDQLLNGMSTIKHLQLQNGQIEIQPQQQPLIVLDETNLDWRYTHHQLNAYGKTLLQGTSAIQFATVLNSFDFSHGVTGKIYLKTAPIDLLPWLNEKNWNGFIWKHGIAQGEIWGEWNKDHWQNVTTNLTLSQLHIAYADAEPWGINADNFHLNLHWQPKNTQFSLDSSQGELSLGKIFREHMPYQKLNINGQWTKDNKQNNQLSTSALQIKTSDAAVNGKLLITWAPTVEANMTLTANADFNNLNNASHYLPAGIMPPSVTNWLDKAIVSGKSATAEMLWRGPLKHFPFHDQSGTMQIHGLVHDVTLNFSPDWPTLTQLDADLYFTSHGMHILATKGMLGNIPISQVSADIPEFAKQSQLLIHSQLQSQLATAWEFLSHTPLQKTLSFLLNQMKAQGAINLILDLNIPLYEEDSPPPQYHGQIFFNQDQIELLPAPIKLSQLSGQLMFDNRGLQSTALTAHWFDEPWSLQLSKPGEAIQLKMSGKVPLESWINDQFKFASNWIKGKTFLTADLKILPDESFALNLQSSLQGVETHLFSLDKTRETLTPLSIRIAKTADQPLSTQMEWQASQGIVKVSNQNSNWNLFSPIASGNITAPANANTPWQINLQNLNLKNMDFSQSTLGNTTIQTPAMEIQLSNLTLPSIAFDKVRLSLRPTANGVAIKNFQLSKAAVNIVANGQWHQLSNGSIVTQLNAQLITNNFSTLLQAFDFPPIMTAETPKISMALQWPGTLWQFDKTQLTGKLNINTGQGIFADISNQASNEINLGRLFNILSIGDLPDYLSSKFQGLTEKGFPFSQLNGSMNLQAMRLNKIDVQIAGPIADVALNGCMNLTDKSLNVVAQVKPHLTSSLPVIATVAGGPILGAIGFVADRLFIRPTVGELSASYYLVQGDEHHPSTTKIARSQAKNFLAKC